MAVKLSIDTGVKEYEINGGEANGGGTLRFNPADPNVYNRFFAAQEELLAVDREMAARADELDGKEDGEKAEAYYRLMADYDAKIKARLQEMFGAQNDFDALLGGVNIMAVAKNGERVVTNLLAALEPIITEGARSSVEGKVAAAKANRAQRRAAQG